MMRTWKSTMLALTFAPLALMAACGGGGGSDSGAGITAQMQNPPSSPTANTVALSDVPLAGTVQMDCGNSGLGVVDSVTNAASNLTPGALPTALPNLSDILPIADLSSVPVIGGLLQGSQGQLTTVSADSLTSLLPTGASGLASLPVPGQLPAYCSSLVGSLPANALTDPSVLLSILGNPTNVLGVIPILDSQNNPVASLLATIPGGLIPGSISSSSISLPGVTQLPVLTSTVPIDTVTLPVVGDTLSTLVPTLLNVLDTNSLLSGGLLNLAL